MGKIICISDSYPQHPRLEKVAEYFNQGLDYQIAYILWDRTRTDLCNSNYNYIYKSRASYGKKIAKLFKLPGFSKYILRTIKKEKPEIIICRHWSVYFIVAFTYFGCAKIVYDVCDMPSNRLIRFLEKLIVKKADSIVLASRFFREFYKSDNMLVLENRIKKEIVKKPGLKQKADDKFKLTYLGKIRYFPILKNLVESVTDNEKVELNFYGDGSDYEKLKMYCEQVNAGNVKFHGRYSQEDISEIYDEADLIWCAYPNDNFNVKYAISNKFFETVAFKVPGIFSKGTKLSEEVDKYGIGFSVNPYDVKSIKNLIEKVYNHRDLIDNAVKNIQKYDKNMFWEDYFIRSDAP